MTGLLLPCDIADGRLLLWRKPVEDHLLTA